MFGMRGRILITLVNGPICQIDLDGMGRCLLLMDGYGGGLRGVLGIYFLMMSRVLLEYLARCGRRPRHDDTCIYLPTYLPTE